MLNEFTNCDIRHRARSDGCVRGQSEYMAALQAIAGSPVIGSKNLGSTGKKATHACGDTTATPARTADLLRRRGRQHGPERRRAPLSAHSSLHVCVCVCGRGLDTSPEEFEELRNWSRNGLGVRKSDDPNWRYACCRKDPGRKHSVCWETSLTPPADTRWRAE